MSRFVCRQNRSLTRLPQSCNDCCFGVVPFVVLFFVHVAFPSFFIPVGCLFPNPAVSLVEQPKSITDICILFGYLLFFSTQFTMGNGTSVAMGAAAAKNEVSSFFSDEQPPPSSTKVNPKKLALEKRGKEHIAEYEQKKKEHAEKKKRLSAQWAANKQSNRAN